MAARMNVLAPASVDFPSAVMKMFTLMLINMLFAVYCRPKSDLQSPGHIVLMMGEGLENEKFLSESLNIGRNIRGFEFLRTFHPPH